MRRTLIVVLALLVVAASPAGDVAGDGEPCTVIEKDGHVYVNPEGCVPENQQNGNNGGGG